MTQFSPQSPAPTQIGSSVFANGAMTATTATTIVPAVANSKGIVVRTATLIGPSAGGIVQFCGGAVAPTGPNSNPALMTTSAAGGSVQNSFPILIPAGQGFFAFNGGTAGGSAYASYDIL